MDAIAKALDKKILQNLLSNMIPEEGGKAIPLIQIDEKTGAFEVDPQAMVLLESLPRDKKVAVVAIAGPYRTGKSFLANRLLNQSAGFEIGSTTQACTKGIWMWNKPVAISEEVSMLLIDTEGLASTERSTNVDIKIFTLSVLLASLFIYNQMGPITENSIEDLSLVANLTNLIRVGSDDDIKNYFPSFFWVMRDFYHDLEGRTPKQYLEDCLQENPRLSADSLKKNKVRGAIVSCFKERECFALGRPVTEEAKLAHVEKVPWDNLRPEFKRQAIHLVNTVGRKLKPKVIAGKHLNGSMFLQLALEYTEALNSKEAPTVLTALDRVIQAETVKVCDLAFHGFRDEVDAAMTEESLPMSQKEFSKIERRLRDKYQLQFQRQLASILSFADILKETDKFKEKIREHMTVKQQQNYSASYHFSKGLLSSLLKDLKDTPPIHEYLSRWQSALRDYHDQGGQSCL